MSVQICCRDQRKVGQVIDQVKMLANNLDELRSEIDTLKINCLEKDNDFTRQTGNTKNNILKKFKRYVRKITSIHSMKNGRKPDSQEVYYPCTNSDPPVSSFLNYILRIGKRGDVWQIPTRVKYLKNEGNQTDGQLEDRVENREFTKHRITQNKIFPKKYVTPQCSDISCELDSRVETPFSSTSNLPSNLSTIRNESKRSSQNMEAFVSNGIDKGFTAASTQTTAPNSRKNRKTMKLQSKHPNLYFSKIKNAVITKKIIKNSNESTFTVCRNDYPYRKKKFTKQCPCDKKRKNNYTETIDHDNIDDKLSLDKIIERLKDVSYANDDTAQEEQGSSSSSVSVDLELNISDSSSKVDEFTERRKPRTYVVRKTSQKRGEDNWSNHFEKSVIYVGPTSDLTLFSHSFLD